MVGMTERMVSRRLRGIAVLFGSRPGKETKVDAWRMESITITGGKATGLNYAQENCAPQEHDRK